MTAPALTSVSASGTTITLTFDTAVAQGDGAFVISDGNSQSYITGGGLSTRIIGATDTRSIDSANFDLVTYSDTTVVLHLSEALKAGVNYSVTMGRGTVHNASLEGNDKISSTALYKFTAAGAAIDTPSAVVDSTINFTDTGSADYITASADQVLSGHYTGTLGANDFIQVSLDNGASWYKATVDTGANTWSFEGEINVDNLTAGSGGALNGGLLARVSNTAGGSSAQASHSYVYNSHPIDIAVSSSFTFSDDTGSSATDLITKTTAQTINGTYSGTLDAGQFMQVSVDGGTSWTSVTASAGSWHTTGTINLNAGTNYVQARVVDGAGNTSGVGSAEYTLDTSGLTLSGRALTLPGSTDSGVSSSDAITNSAAKVTLNVAGLHGVHAGDTIQIVDTSASSTVVGSYVITDADLYYGDDYFTVAKFDPTGRDTVDITLGSLSNGDHTLAARIVDAAGNIGTASATKTVTIDAAAPILSTTSPLEHAGSVATDLTQLTFTFNENIVIEDDTIVYITDDNNSDNSQEVTLSSSDISGKVLTITLSSALTSGTSYTVQGAIISDLAGNAGVTGDTPMLHFTTAGTYGGGSLPAPISASYTDTAPTYDTDDGSSLHTDGVTSNNIIRVKDVAASGTWSYRTSATGIWKAGNSDNFFILADGTYAMDSIQVKQTVDGVDSAIFTINETLVIDTVASSASVAGFTFSSGVGSINGLVTGSTDFSNEFVEVTFDHGASWVQATTTYVSDGTSSWTASGTLGNEYGLRLSDKAGNLTGIAGATEYTSLFYLANDGVNYSHADDNYTSVRGGAGTDTITVGNHASVVSLGGDTITTGDNAQVTVDANATVTTGDGMNTVIAGDHANITTGSGADYITLTSLTGAVVHAGAGKDTLQLSNDTVFSLSSLSTSSGIDVIDFIHGGTNGVTILSASTVQNLTDSNQLTINNTGGGSTTVSMDSLVWHADGTSGGYNVYHNSANTVAVLVGVGITVDLEPFTA
ncbi:beta strand repeat-containing protein [Duganella radicis]|uniref:SbsA Ig-like domain-containing protein n=1 Tax=Duganella radicis TaxID=551988 RepID=A0A6L6PSA5_9BURK|nr:Ig-like domain-containing protein [Duganella radicis]MTV41115.1 hypothetical protein [Duganella radicis]